MPTYDYICTVCLHEFEEFQKMNDPLISKCPECGGKVKRKIGGGAGLLFKGSGFYITDYKVKPDKAEKEKTNPAKETVKSENKNNKPNA